ncbi:MAG: DUF4249 domain-containing protein [Cytophagales bacterium]|nr:DUF4249 domain-containing protein [Bernardetiaceae bacterium]MDW8209603.1 DUF4249 domain-containing protein [Cytophagales bacterium]
MSRLLRQILLWGSGGLSILITSCEDVVNVNLAPSRPQLVIDAFIANQNAPQTIRLTTTVPYFNTTPPGVQGADVIVENLTQNRRFVFVDTRQNGEYRWQPAGNEKLGNIGDDFRLTVRHQGFTYTAACRLNRTTKIDSIVYEFRQRPNFGDNKEGYYAQFYGTDLPGQDDFYWIRAYKNGRLITKPNLINYAFNAVRGGSGAGSDGFVFIPPIRTRITDPQDPYQEGDEVRVEIWSIDKPTYLFLEQAENQINNGGLFARPLENTRTNILSPANAPLPALGWFCVSEVSAAVEKIQPKKR